MSKFKVGQMVEILPHPYPLFPDLVGRITVIKKLCIDVHPVFGICHEIDVPELPNSVIIAAEIYLRPINDPPAEATGDWNTITKLLGTDIRNPVKEREYIS